MPFSTTRLEGVPTMLHNIADIASIFTCLIAAAGIWEYYYQLLFKKRKLAVKVSFRSKKVKVLVKPDEQGYANQLLFTYKNT
jgi:hypothetical protein